MKKKLVRTMVESTMMLSHVLALGRQQAADCERLLRERNEAVERARSLEVEMSEVRSSKGSDLATIGARDGRIAELERELKERTEWGDGVAELHANALKELGAPGTVEGQVSDLARRGEDDRRTLLAELDQARRDGQTAARELASERAALVEAHRIMDRLLLAPYGPEARTEAHRWLALHEVRERQRRARDRDAGAPAEQWANRWRDAK